MKLRGERKLARLRDVGSPVEEDSLSFMPERDISPDTWIRFDRLIDTLLSDPKPDYASFVPRITFSLAVFGKVELLKKLQTSYTRLIEAYLAEHPIYASHGEDLKTRAQAAVSLGIHEPLGEDRVKELMTQFSRAIDKINKLLFLISEKVFSPEKTTQHTLTHEEWDGIFKKLSSIKGTMDFFETAAYVRLYAPEKYSSIKIPNSMLMEARQAGFHQTYGPGDTLTFLANIAICTASEVEITPDGLHVSFTPPPTTPTPPLPPRSTM